MVANSNSLVQINFPATLVMFTVQKQPLANRSLEKTSIKHCKILCRYWLDFDRAPLESAVDFESTFEQ